MDYRKLLGQRTTEVLPYLGGASVDAGSRRLRVTREVAPGWWRFSIAGRRAEPVDHADPPDMSARPRARGHLVGRWLFVGGERPTAVQLLPADELEVFSLVSARRWSRELWLFDTTEFEDDAELAAREALDSRLPIAHIKGASASLRAAFGWALLSRLAQDRSVAVTLSESLGMLREVAERGGDGAAAWLTELRDRRQRATEAVAIRHAIRVAQHHARTAPERIADALDKADATLRRTRTLSDGSVEVRFWYAGETFITVVEADSLRVIDAGICLDGADRVTNLQSLPAVIREAIDTGHLCITRT